MDESTLLRFKSLWSEEADTKRFIGELQHLNNQEQTLYKLLAKDFHGERVRLEQERINYHWLLEVLGKQFGST